MEINSCGAFLSAGLGDCNGRTQPIIGVLISAKNTTYTYAELQTIAKTKTNISLAAGIVSIYVPVSGFNNTSDEANVETSNTGVKGVFTQPVPSARIFLDRSFDDYRQFFRMNSTVVDVEFITSDAKRGLVPISNGAYKGLRGQIFAGAAFPNFENNQEAHPIDIFFKDVAEFQSLEFMQMSYTASEIEGLVPVGLTLRATAAYNGTAGTIVVKATKRNSAVGYAGLDVYVVIDSNVADAVVTGVAGTDGTYTITALKNTTDELVTGDYITIQMNKTVSTYATYITNPLTINGVTP
jgi:hypothetical protein